MSGGLVDLTGHRFGRLLVVHRIEDHVQPSGNKCSRWLCVCDCGAEAPAFSYKLRRGHVRSCGCLNRELVAERNRGRALQPRSDRVGYSGAHRRVSAVRGGASTHPCVDCGLPARDWSYDHADPEELFEEQRGRLLAYSMKPEHYVPRCKRCHNAFDRRLSVEA